MKFILLKEGRSCIQNSVNLDVEALLQYSPVIQDQDPMTLIKIDLGFDPKCVNVDSPGRYILLDTVVQGAKYLFANFYAPKKSLATNSFL